MPKNHIRMLIFILVAVIAAAIMIYALVYTDKYQIFYFFNNVQKKEVDIKEKYGTGLTGIFSSFDQEKNILYLNLYERAMERLMAKPFRVTDDTFFFKIREGDLKEALSKADLAEVGKNAQIKIYYENIANIDREDDFIPILELVEIEDYKPIEFPAP